MEVIKKLKPKVASLGFSKEELDTVATQIQATLSDDATDEQIDAAIDAAIPFLKISQSVASRVINTEKEKKGSTPVEPVKPPEGDEPPSWAKALIESNTQLKAELNTIKSGKTLETRKQILESKLKYAPETFKNKILKDFSRMNFEKDEDFEAYASETETDLTAFSQDLANMGLSKMRRPGTGSGPVDEISELVGQIETGTKQIIEQSKK